MTLHTYHSGSPGQHDQGFALITALIFLLVVTIVGVTMYSRVTKEQTMAGNIQQKTMALSAADYASQSARHFLRTASSAEVAGVPAHGLATNPVSDATWDIAANPNADIHQLDGVEFLGELLSTASDEDAYAAYAAYPKYYIEYSHKINKAGGCGLQTGTGCGGGGKGGEHGLYRITAWGVGGNAAAVAITRMLYVQ